MDPTYFLVFKNAEAAIFSTMVTSKFVRRSPLLDAMANFPGSLPEKTVKGQKVKVLTVNLPYLTTEIVQEYMSWQKWLSDNEKGTYNPCPTLSYIPLTATLADYLQDTRFGQTFYPATTLTIDFTTRVYKSMFTLPMTDRHSVTVKVPPMFSTEERVDFINKHIDGYGRVHEFSLNYATLSITDENGIYTQKTAKLNGFMWTRTPSPKIDVIPDDFPLNLMPYVVAEMVALIAVQKAGSYGNSFQKFARFVALKSVATEAFSNTANCEAIYDTFKIHKKNRGPLLRLRTDLDALYQHCVRIGAKDEITFEWDPYLRQLDAEMSLLYQRIHPLRKWGEEEDSTDREKLQQIYDEKNDAFYKHVMAQKVKKPEITGRSYKYMM
jgi:hypothetical protein